MLQWRRLNFPDNFAPHLHASKLALFVPTFSEFSFTGLKALHISNIESCQYFTTQALGKILTVCRGVHTLEIDKAFDLFDFVEQHEPVLMKFLKMLSVSTCYEHHTELWSRIIQAPTLNQLCLQVDLAWNNLASSTTVHSCRSLPKRWQSAHLPSDLTSSSHYSLYVLRCYILPCPA